MESQNQHYITRSLLKLWEYKPGMVNYYSYSNERLKTAPTLRLFSGDNIWNPQLETFFNEVSEKWVANSIEVLSQGSGDFEVSPELYRALVLFLIIHVNRVEEFRTGNTGIDRQK